MAAANARTSGARRERRAGCDADMRLLPCCSGVRRERAAVKTADNRRSGNQCCCRLLRATSAREQCRSILSSGMDTVKSSFAAIAPDVSDSSTYVAGYSWCTRAAARGRFEALIAGRQAMVHPAIALTRENPMSLRIYGAAALFLFSSFSAHAGLNCADVLKQLGKQLADAKCFVSSDLTTNNDQTTPP